jgi:hypothetical protein
MASRAEILPLTRPRVHKLFFYQFDVLGVTRTCSSSSSQFSSENSSFSRCWPFSFWTTKVLIGDRFLAGRSAGEPGLVCAEFLVNEGQGATLGARALVPWLIVSGSGGDYTQAAAS